ncbi:MAG: glycosyltransferase family 9 protein [candidate division KSB1 bacterium]|nr:glycosyltransferase family 9 protein [candidate division KSB1 bacterium]MDZ7365869.1 glycosyltransferase family 9 protein [candidate division KSB1 bacterium]MDZ7403896.1 glycosyltransferase family 9 protein [candidate division KSB1 bacterium]
MLLDTQRIKIAKRIDEHGGRWLIRLVDSLRRPRSHESTKPGRILIIKFWGIGSIILFEPALRYLRKKFPQARLDFLTLAQNRELFKLLPHIDQVYAADFRRLGRFLISTLRLIVKLRRQKYDLIFDAEFFANFSTLVATLAKPRRVIGFSREASIKSRLLDVAVPFHDDEHAAENFLRLVKIGTGEESGSNKSVTFPRLILPSSPATTLRFNRRPYIVMNVNASPLALERRWPQERFASLAKWLLKRYQTDLILIGARGEEKYTQAVAQAIAAPGKVHNLAGNLNLLELAGLIRHAALFISNDSGPLHLAAALQKPVVGFYGPETPKRFGPLCKNRLIFYLDLPCSPCMSVDNAKTVNCTNQIRCMLDLKVLMVMPRLQRFIDARELLPQRIYQEETVIAI